MVVVRRKIRISTENC